MLLFCPTKRLLIHSSIVMCSSSFSPAFPLVVVCRPPPPLPFSSLSCALFDCCVFCLLPSLSSLSSWLSSSPSSSSSSSSVLRSHVAPPRHSALAALDGAALHASSWRARAVLRRRRRLLPGTRRRGARGRWRCRRRPTLGRRRLSSVVRLPSSVPSFVTPPSSSSLLLSPIHC